MKHYELMKYANNSVGAVFIYCTEKELESKKESFEPDNVSEVSKEEYDDGIKTQERKAMRMFTGYPK